MKDQLFFKKIRWKNLLSTGNVFTEIDLSVGVPTMIIGKNGSGKSTFLDAMMYVLFGKPYRNINKPQLINSITRKELLVEIEFDTLGHSFVVSRGMRPNVFTITRDGESLDQHAETRDHQEYLERIVLRTNLRTFRHTEVIGSASYKPFMELSTGERRAFIEDLLDMNVFSIMNTLLKTRISNTTSSIQEFERHHELINSKIQMINEHREETFRRNDRYIKDRYDAIDQITTKIDDLKIAKQQLIEKYQEVKSKLDSFNLNSLYQQKSELENHRHRISNKISMINEEIEFFRHNLTCPTCSQSIDKKVSESTIERKIAEIEQLDASLQLIPDAISKRQQKIDECEELQKQIEDIRNDGIVNETLISNNKEQISNIKKEIAVLENEGFVIDDSGLDALVAKSDEIAADIVALQKDLRNMTTTSLMLKDNGIKTKIINKYIPIINTLINKYLAEFEMLVDFNLDEQFNETIKSRHRDIFSYQSFSEGEKQKINHAILFTWRAVAKMRNGLNTNILILDEVFDSSLDSNSVIDLNRIIQAQGNTGVFVISHRDIDNFENVIEFTKTKNFSVAETKTGGRY